MDQQRFDRLIATLGAGTGRRRAVAGLVAGAAAVLGRATPTAAKKKKRCKKCRPQQSCCSCRSVAQGPATTCFLIEGLGNADAQDRCIKACGANLLFAVNTPINGALYACKTDHTCDVKSC